MAIWDSITDIIDAVTPWSTVEAEAPAEPAPEPEAAETKEEPAEEPEEEEEEEEEEIVDPKETLEEECKESKGCASHKHHFDECVERVTGPAEKKLSENEDCVEEFFHLAHCATACAAPKLWAQLK